MPKKKAILKKLEQVEKLLEDDVEYNWSLLKFENRLVAVKIEHPEYSKASS